METTNGHRWIGALDTPRAHCMTCRRGRTAAAESAPCAGPPACTCGHHLDDHDPTRGFPERSATACRHGTYGEPCDCQAFVWSNGPEKIEQVLTMDKKNEQDPGSQMRVVVSRAMDALESDAPKEERAAAWNALRDEFFPVGGPRPGQLEEAGLATFRHGPYTTARALAPLEAQAVKKLDEAAALLAEAAGLLAAAHQDEKDGRTRFGGPGIAGTVSAVAMRASGIAREGAAALEGRRP